MLTIPSDRSSGFRDGSTRRDFLRIGALAMGGLTLPQLLRAEAEAGLRNSHKSVIMVYLPGGPSHLDVFDYKEDAPRQIRGEFSAIPTKVPGIQLCEHLPRIAANMDKFAIVRSLTDSAGAHSNFQCETGHRSTNQPAGGWPSMGSVLARDLGQKSTGVPSAIAVNNASAGAGFLGSAYRPFLPNGQGRSDMTLDRRLTTQRLEDRKELLKSFDTLRRDADKSGLMAGQDEFNRMAFEVVTSNKLVEALDLNKASKAERDRYSQGVMGNYKNNVEQFLIARRLVEAGARYVTLNYGGWDTHSGNFTTLKKQLPGLDRGLATLVEDLHYLGLAGDVSVVVWGEFGRTPKVNAGGGRDHWPKVSGAFLAGGGMRTGQAIGSTDRNGAEANSRPTSFGEVFATLYHNCGLDPAKLRGTDLSGRPVNLVDPNHKPMRELV